MIAVVPVRSGELPAGGAETVAEAGGRALLVGRDPERAAGELAGIASRVWTWDTPGFAPGKWASALAGVLAKEHVVILPASPDGRDLAPRIAALLGHPLVAGAVEVRPERITTIGFAGIVMAEHPVRDAVVVTFQPGVRGVQASPELTTVVTEMHLEPSDIPEAEILDVLAAEVTTMDLAEAPRIVGGGAGLNSAERFEQLTRIATALDASVGTTRVVTDKGWLSHDRQIGTTGVVVDPRLYLAFGISGAVQHTSGLGQPDHIISVNTEPHCPMMSLADLAIVADANATLDALESALAPSTPTPSGEATDSTDESGSAAQEPLHGARR